MVLDWPPVWSIHLSNPSPGPWLTVWTIHLSNPTLGPWLTICMNHSPVQPHPWSLTPSVWSIHLFNPRPGQNPWAIRTLKYLRYWPLKGEIIVVDWERCLTFIAWRFTPGPVFVLTLSWLGHNDQDYLDLRLASWDRYTFHRFTGTSYCIHVSDPHCQLQSDDPSPLGMLDRFDNRNMPTEYWRRVLGGYLGPGCGIVDFGNSLYFDGAGTREAVTVPLDTSERRWDGAAMIQRFTLQE